MISRKQIVEALARSEDWLLRTGGTNALLDSSALLGKIRENLLSIVEDAGGTVTIAGHIDMPGGAWVRRSDAYRGLEIAFIVPETPGSTVMGDLIACGKIKAEAVLTVQRAKP